MLLVTIKRIKNGIKSLRKNIENLECKLKNSKKTKVLIKEKDLKNDVSKLFKLLDSDLAI